MGMNFNVGAAPVNVKIRRMPIELELIQNKIVLKTFFLSVLSCKRAKSL